MKCPVGLRNVSSVNTVHRPPYRMLSPSTDHPPSYELYIIVINTSISRANSCANLTASWMRRESTDHMTAASVTGQSPTRETVTKSVSTKLEIHSNKIQTMLRMPLNVNRV